MDSKIVFIIDSDHEARVAIRSAMEKANHFVISATSGAEALLLIHNMSRPHMILLNPNIYDMDYETLLYQMQRLEKFSETLMVEIGSTDIKKIRSAKSIVSPRDISPALALLKK